MYSNNVSLMRNIVEQVKWKLDIYRGMLISFIVVQLFISIIGSQTGMSSRGFNNLVIEQYFYSLDGVLALSIVTAFSTCLVMPTKRLQMENLSIPTTRLTANISTILFICVMMFIATLTAIASYAITQFVQVLVYDLDVISATLLPSGTTFFMLYLTLLFAAAIGYFIGTLWSMSRVLTVSILVVVGLAIFLMGIPVNAWFFSSSINLYMLKALLISMMLYAATLFINNRQEVRRG